MVDAVGEPNCFSFLLELLVWHAKSLIFLVNFFMDTL